MIKKFNFFNDAASYFYKFFNLTMKEGLIISVEYEFFIDKLKKLLNSYDNINFNILQKKEYVELYINLKNINHKIFDKQLYKIINNTGYFVSKLIDIKEDKEIKSILISKNYEFILNYMKI